MPKPKPFPEKRTVYIQIVAQRKVTDGTLSLARAIQAAVLWMVSFDGEEFGKYFAAVKLFDPLQEPVPGVLVQGPDAPYILSALHCFEKEGIHHHRAYEVLLFLPDQVIQCKFAMANSVHDFIVFRVIDLIDRYTAPVDIEPASCNMGKAYIMFGYSTCYKVNADGRWCLTWNATPGNIASYMLNSRCVAASGGSVPGDSGGPVFSFETKKLIGINLAIANINGGWPVEQTARAPLSPHALIKPLWFIDDILASQSGRRFFGPGGVNAMYATTSSATTTNVERHMSVILPVPRRPQETLCAAGLSVYGTVLRESLGSI